MIRLLSILILLTITPAVMKQVPVFANYGQETEYNQVPVSNPEWVTVTSGQLLALYERVRENSYKVLTRVPTLALAHTYEIEAYATTEYGGMIVLGARFGNDALIKKVDFNNPDYDDLDVLVTLGHEYGHHIQYAKGSKYDQQSMEFEIEATTYASYALLKMGYTEEMLISFYEAQAMLSEGESSPGHPNPSEEFRQCARNVKNAAELLNY